MQPHSSRVRTLACLNDVLSWPDVDVVRQRFWSKVQQAAPHECWIWHGWWDARGCGRFHIARKGWYAPRVAYVFTAGPIPDKQYVRHRCHQPRCVNPAHLCLGTQADNMADMRAAGRAVFWGRPALHATSKVAPPVSPYRYATIEEKVLARIAKGEPDACWLWTGCVNRGGYGNPSWQRDGVIRRYAAHRVAWTIAHGDIPAGQHVLHLCESRYPPGDRTGRRCCNPAHLTLGTSRENSRHCRMAGRAPVGARNGAYTHPDHVPRGEHHGNAKLTADQARQMREQRVAGASTRDLIARFGVSESVVYRVVRGLSYRDALGSERSQSASDEEEQR